MTRPAWIIKKIVLGIVLMVWAMPVLSVELYAETKVFSAQETGEQLVRQVWSEIGSRYFTALEAMMAPSFQSVHSDGARGKEEEMSLLKGLNADKYELSDFHVTESDADILIVTYKIAVVETLAGKTTSPKPSPRMSVFQKMASGWKWIAHANLATA